MTIKAIISIALAAITTNSFGQKVFTLNDASTTYDTKIEVKKCPDGTCSGKGSVKLYAKNSSKLFQELKSPDLYFMLDASSQPDMTGPDGPVVFGDVNFDGTEDLAIRNGNRSGYGGPSYDVYVYNSTSKRLVLSKELTRLASTNLGMFAVDTDRKRIITESKSGSSTHYKSEYEVTPKMGLVKVLDVVENANGDYVNVTTKTLVKGKWQKSTKKHKTSEYYKD